MKNLKKFVAAFAAAAMVMSIGVSAFAEVFVPQQRNDWYSDGNLTLSVTSDEEHITVMAYTVPSDTTLDNIPDFDEDVHTIIALDQEAGSTGFSNIPVDETKVGDSSIVVKVGGSNGDIATYLISFENQVITYSVVFNYGEGTGTPESKTFDDDDTIADVINGVVAEMEDTDEFTYEFLGWATTADGEVIADTSALMKSLDTDGDKAVTLYAKYEATPVEKPVDTITVLIGDVDNTVGVAASDYIQIRGYVNLTDAQKEMYRGKVGTTVGNLIIGDVDNTVGVAASDYIQVRGYVNLTDAQKEMYRGKVGTTVEVEVEK